MKLHNWFGLTVLGLVTFTINTTSAQKLQLDTAVKTGKLSNGFTYYIRKNDVQKKRVVMYLVNKVGSILETDDQQGLAHFMEHMNFNGSTNFPGSSLVDFLEKTGVRFGADLNAYTSFDETVYQLPLPIEDPGMLKSGLQVMRDWAHGATLDAVEINKERGVIMEEKRLRTGAEQRFSDKYFPLIVNGSRYAFRSPIGTDEVLKNFKPQTLRSFYSDWYRPDLQALIVVGDIDVKEIEGMVRKMFSDLRNPLKAKARPVYQIPLTGKNQFIALTDKETQNSILRMFIKHPHQGYQSEADYRNYMLRNLFNQMMSKRFQDASQKNSENYLSASASIAPYLANIDIFNAVLSARPGELEKGFKAFWTEIVKIKAKGFTITELDAAKTQYAAQMKSLVTERANSPSVGYVQEYVNNFLKGNAVPGLAKESELFEKYLPGIVLKDMEEIAKAYITDINKDVVITAPESSKSSLPDEQKMNLWFAETQKEYLIAGKNNDVAFQPAMQNDLLDKLPVKGKVVSTRKLEEINVTELILSNGVKVVLKPTTFKNDEISISAFSPGGTSLYSDTVFYSAVNASNLIAGGGIGSLSAEQLRNKLNGKRVSVGPYINERTEGIGAGTSVGDLETALQLIYLYFTQPRKDTSVFKANMSRFKAVLASPVRTPEKVFSDTLNAVISNYHFRRKSIQLDQLDQVSLDKAYDIYKERFSDASDFTFVVVGSFDAIAIQPLLEQYLGGLPSTNRKESTKDLAIEIPEGKIQKTVYSGSTDKATVQLVISGDFKLDETNIVKLQAINSFLTFRMLERLREKEGGIYSPGVNVSISRIPRSRYAFFIKFGCAPENVEKLIAAAWDEITRLKTTGPSADDLKKFIAEEKVKVNTAVETNTFWLSYLTGQYQEQRDPAQILKYNGLLDALTTEQLKEALNLYVSDKNYIRVVLLPEIAK